MPLSDILLEYNEKASKGGKYEHVSLTKEGVIPKTDRYERDFLVTHEDKQYRITHINDICYNPANLKFGVICRNKYKDAIFSPIYVTFRVQSGFLPNYVEAYVTRTDFINHALKYEEGTVYERMAVSPDDLLSITVHFPTENEQAKIANFLDHIQYKIDKQSELVEALKKYKRGLLSAIFERRIRFKADDGSEFPEWEQKRLGDLMDFKNGVNASREAFQQGRIKCIGVSDIYIGNPIYSCNILGAVVLSEIQETEYAVEYGDVLFQRSSETQEDIGHAVIYMDKCQSAVFNGFVIRGKKRAEYHPLYLHYELQTDFVRKQTIRLGAGAQHYNIGQESLATIFVKIPSLPEQEKIAIFLEFIDKMILIEEEKANAIQSIKQGLLQQLFI